MKWLLSAIALAIGIALAMAFSRLVGMQYHDHDFSVTAMLIAGFIGGTVAGAVAAIVWLIVDERQSK
jgi:uncharacterized membrane protein YkvI